MLYISSKEIFIGLSKFYYDSNFIDSKMKVFDSAFQDVFVDGNLTILNDQDYNLTNLGYINEKYLFENLKNNLSKTFSYLNLEIVRLDLFIIGNGYVKQIDPWTIEINATFRYEIADKSNFARWEGITNKIVRIPVYGIYSYSNNNKNNKAKINSSWKVDEGIITEKSVLEKLKGNGNNQRGLCLSGCDES